MEGFIGCRCRLLICIGFVLVKVLGPFEWGLYSKVFGGLVRIGCLSLCASRNFWGMVVAYGGCGGGFCFGGQSCPVDSISGGDAIHVECVEFVGGIFFSHLGRAKHIGGHVSM